MNLVEKRISVNIGGRELAKIAPGRVNLYNLECELAARYFSTSFLLQGLIWVNLVYLELFTLEKLRELKGGLKLT